MTKKLQKNMNHLPQKIPHYILIHPDLTISRTITFTDSHIQGQQHTPSAGVRGALGTRRSRPSHVGPTLLTDADLLDEQDPLEESAV